MTPEQAAALREPFPPNQIGKLPKAGTTLDYVGHAAVTDRLLQVDPSWYWEPVAFAEDGAPLIRYDGQNANLWIRLSICGMTRLGVGIVSLKAFELEKQLISDALRNAAMRFGVALDLWSKQDLHDMEQEAKRPVKGPDPQPTSKGNERRGPRVLPGWVDYDEQRGAHDAYKERALEELDEPKRAELKAAFPEWPMTAEQMTAAAAKLDDLAHQLTLEDVF